MNGEPPVRVALRVDEAAKRCRAAGCVIGAGPLDAPWGERYVEVEDPYGYAWKFFQLLPDVSHDGLRAVADQWFGPAEPVRSSAWT